MEISLPNSCIIRGRETEGLTEVPRVVATLLLSPLVELLLHTQLLLGGGRWHLYLRRCVLRGEGDAGETT